MKKRNQLWKKIRNGFILGCSIMYLTLPVIAQETETEIEITEAPEREILTLQWENKEMHIVSHLEEKIDQVYLRSSSNEEWSDNLLQNDGKILYEEVKTGTAEQETDAGEELYDLAVISDGVKYGYYGIDLQDDGELRIYAEKSTGAAWALCTDLFDNDVKDQEDVYPIVISEQEYLVYALTPVNIRSIPDASGDILRTLGITEETLVRGQAGEWLMVWTGKQYGFVKESFVSSDLEDAKNAEAAEEAAVAAAAAAAAEAQRQAAAAAAAAQQQNNTSGGGNQSYVGPSVVRTEDVPNCDDGSHGTRYIYYSDGTVSANSY